MGTKYSTNTVSGYNATPPSDDGSATEANKVKWSTIKTKLADPVNTLAAAVNTDLVTHFDKGPVAYTSNQTLGATHYNQFVQVSGASVTLTLSDASTLGAGWFCDIVNTDQSNNVTLGLATASDMINQVSASDTIYPQQGLRVFVNAAANGFQTMADVSREANNTITGANTFSGNGTFTGTNTFSTTSAGVSPVKIVSTDAGATIGPGFTLHRNSASPAALDVIGNYDYSGEDSADNEEVYARTLGVIVDPTSTSEDGAWKVQTVQAGTLASRISVEAGLTVGSPTGEDKGAGTINATAIYDDGTQILPGNALLRDVTSTNTSNSASETTVFTDTVPANSLSTNRMLHITMLGGASDSASGTSTITIRVKYGGTTALTLTLTHGSTGNKIVRMEAWISADNATNSQQAHGQAFMSANHTDASSVALESEAYSRHGTLAIDSTSAQTLAVTTQMGTASANISNTIDVTHVELI